MEDKTVGVLPTLCIQQVTIKDYSSHGFEFMRRTAGTIQVLFKILMLAFPALFPGLHELEALQVTNGAQGFGSLKFSFKKRKKNVH
jgi:hypothetical protein